MRSQRNPQLQSGKVKPEAGLAQSRAGELAVNGSSFPERDENDNCSNGKNAGDGVSNPEEVMILSGFTGRNNTKCAKEGSQQAKYHKRVTNRGTHHHPREDRQATSHPQAALPDLQISRPSVCDSERRTETPSPAEAVAGESGSPESRVS